MIFRHAENHEPGAGDFRHVSFVVLACLGFGIKTTWLSLSNKTTLLALGKQK